MEGGELMAGLWEVIYRRKSECIRLSDREREGRWPLGEPRPRVYLLYSLLPFALSILLVAVAAVATNSNNSSNIPGLGSALP